MMRNWFRAKGEISQAALSRSLNNKIRVVTRRSFGFLEPIKPCGNGPVSHAWTTPRTKSPPTNSAEEAKLIEVPQPRISEDVEIANVQCDRDDSIAILPKPSALG